MLEFAPHVARCLLQSLRTETLLELLQCTDWIGEESEPFEWIGAAFVGRPESEQLRFIRWLLSESFPVDREDGHLPGGSTGLTAIMSDVLPRFEPEAVVTAVREAQGVSG